MQQLAGKTALITGGAAVAIADNYRPLETEAAIDFSGYLP
jgi:hypothetical protein